MARDKFDVNKTVANFLSKDKKRMEKGDFIQTAFYISEEQNNELALYAVKNKTNKSAVVRLALKEYLEKMN